jgi:ketosteroid isomerase-like protein
MKRYFHIALLASSTFILSCNQNATEGKAISSDASASDITAATEDIRNQGKAFEVQFERGDSAAVASHYASDAMLMPPNSDPIKKDGIAAFWGAARRMAKALKMNITDVSGSGDVMYETGTYEMTGDNNAVIDKGKYVVVWKKENGNWKIARDIWNATMMPEPAK